MWITKLLIGLKMLFRHNKKGKRAGKNIPSAVAQNLKECKLTSKAFLGPKFDCFSDYPFDESFVFGLLFLW